MKVEESHHLGGTCGKLSKVINLILVSFSISLHAKAMLKLYVRTSRLKEYPECCVQQTLTVALVIWQIQNLVPCAGYAVHDIWPQCYSD